MNLFISYHSGVPIYEQITGQIKEMILSGELTEGEALPSIRQLAKDLRISVITTTRAYNELENEGFIATMPGKGCYVLPRNKEMIREQYLRRVEGHLAEAIADAVTAGINHDELIEILKTLLKEEGSHE